MLRQYDLTWSGFVVMWVVWIWDGMETRHVAESAAISKATLTGVMKTLESRGWLIRESSVADRRLVQLRLTQSGIDLMTELYPKFNAAESDVVRQLSARSKASLARDLRSIVRTVEANGAPATESVPEACSARRVNECSKDAGLHRISVRGVLGVPLDAEIPPLVAVDGDGLDRPVRGVRRRPQPLTEHTQALMVIAGDG